MINKSITKKNVLAALSEINKDGVPAKRKSTKYDLYHNGKRYPPKYALSIASKLATGKELEASEFSGGVETNNFLMFLGFTIKEGSNTIL